MLVKERSRLTREKSTRNYYIGAGWAGVWGLKSVPDRLGRRLGRAVPDRSMVPF